MAKGDWIPVRGAEGTHSRQAHADLPEGTYEREIGRDGFFGPATHVYHRHPPTGWSKFEGPLRPRAFDAVKAAKEPELKKAFTTHREETQGQIERLEQVFEMIGKRPQAKPCEAINGIVAEGDETIEDFGESPAIDTGLVAAGQAVEHYEMARYGALAAWAGQLGMPKAVTLFNETLQEEMKAESLLTQIAKSKADKTAATKIAA